MNSSVASIMNCADQVIKGIPLDRKQARALMHTEAHDTLFLLASADRIRQYFCGDSISFCADINARSGRCTEDCRFCAQSGYYHTGVKEYALRSEEDLLRQAKAAEAYGAARFGIVTSGRGQEDPVQFRHIVSAVRKIREETGLEVCCSLGLLTEEQLNVLREAGAVRIHCNLETSERNFPNICTTHTYQDKIRHIRRIREAGLEVCCGGILGLGETEEDQLDLAFALQKLEICSVPLNLFTSIPGTPFAHRKGLTPMEACRIFAVFRFILPRAVIRVCAGREKSPRDLQAMAFASGLNGAMIGGYLTIEGQPPERDRQMARDLGRTGGEAGQDLS